MSVDLNLAVQRVRTWLTAEYPGKPPLSAGWEVILTDEVDNPWLLIDARPQMPYEVGTVPGEVSFAVFRATGALHRVIEGEVQDPELEVS